MNNKIRHFLNLDEISSSEIKKILSLSHQLKKKYGQKKLIKKKF